MILCAHVHVIHIICACLQHDISNTMLTHYVSPVCTHFMICMFTARVVIAELVSVAKRTLARALFIVISEGFGLVKPRLGPTLCKLVAVCLIYFILASVEGCLRVMQVRIGRFLELSVLYINMFIRNCCI